MLDCRVTGDGELLGSIGIASEHVGRDETGASKVSLVAQDPVEFQWMTNRLMDLQHHLIRHRKKIQSTGWTFRCLGQRDRLVGNSCSPADQTGLQNDLKTALAAEPIVITSKTSGLRHAIHMGRHRDRRDHPAMMLHLLAAEAGQA